MVRGQYVFVATASSDGEASNFICLNLGYKFCPNVHFVRADGWKGINREGLCSVGGKVGLGFGGADALLILGNMNSVGFVEEGGYLAALV